MHFCGYINSQQLRLLYPSYHQPKKNDRIIIPFSGQVATITWIHKKIWFRHTEGQQLIMIFVHVRSDEPYAFPDKALPSDPHRLNYFAVWPIPKLIPGTPEHDSVPWVERIPWRERV